jgi:YVTN family beta-propeller protein
MPSRAGHGAAAPFIAYPGGNSMLSSIRSLIAAALVLASAAAVAAPKVYVGNFGDNTVSVIDTATRTVVATIPVAQGPHGMAITRDGRTVYVTGDGSSEMSVIDTATDKVVKTVEVGKTPNGVSLTAGDKLALVAVYAEDRIAFFDTAAQTVVGSVAVPKPHTISISPDGKLAYVTTQEPGHFALTVVDIAARAVVRSVPLEKTPRDAEFGYDGKAFYFTEAGVSAVQVLDPATDRIVAEIPTGVSPHFVNVFRSAPLGMVIVQGPGQVLLFDPATNKPVRTIGVGKQPHWLALSGDGKTAYVSNEGSADVSLVDIGSGSTTSVAVGKSPRKIVVQPSAEAAGSAAKVSAGELAFVSLSKVSIAGFAFQPQAINIKAGESVAWSNDDGPAHTITFKDGSAGTKNLAPGEAFTRAFDRPGTYEYFCSFHPYMTGRVVVTAK